MGLFRGNLSHATVAGNGKASQRHLHLLRDQFSQGRVAPIPIPTSSSAAATMPGSPTENPLLAEEEREHEDHEPEAELYDSRTLLARIKDAALCTSIRSVFGGTALLLLVVTLVVVPIEWHDIDKGSPPICSKGGVATVLANPNGTEVPYLYIFSGNTKHGRLISASRTYSLGSRKWRPLGADSDKSFGEPAPRWKSAAVPFANGTKMFMFGGQTLADSSNEQVNHADYEYAYANDLWELSIASSASGDPSWRRVPFDDGAVLPTPRKAHCAANLGGSMHVFGGKYCGKRKNGRENGHKESCWDLADLWRIDLESVASADGEGGWEKLWETKNASAVDGPSPRHGHTCVAAKVFDQVSGNFVDYLVVFAGRADKDGYYNDVWAWDGRNGTWEDWTPDYDHSTEETVPAKRDHHHVATMAASPDGRTPAKMILFGGRGDPLHEKHQHKHSQVLGDLWEFDYTKRTWKEIKQKGRRIPSPRFLSDYTQTEDKFILFGGDERVENGGRLDDLWQLDRKTHEWERLEKSYEC